MKRLDLTALREALEPQVARGFTYPTCLTAEETLALVEAVDAAHEYINDHWSPTFTEQGLAQAHRLRAAFARIGWS